MQTLTRTETAAFLLSRDRFLILTHRKPDGDTLGSASALCRGLRSLGKSAWVLRNPEATDRYQPFFHGLWTQEIPADATVLSVDVAAENMLPKNGNQLPVALKIDHHGIGTGFAEFGLVEPASASCAEIIHDLLQELGVEPDAAMAQAVYLGVSTDTGCFCYANVTAHTFQTAAACLAAGTDAYAVNRVFFETKRLSRLKLEAYLVQHMERFAQGRIALCAIPGEIEREYGVNDDDTDNLSSFLRCIEGVDMGITLRQDAQGVTKISARCIPGWDVARVCAELGGGGHACAAGGRVKADLTTARAKLLEVLARQGYL